VHPIQQVRGFFAISNRIVSLPTIGDALLLATDLNALFGGLRRAGYQLLFPLIDRL
jgi:hypothetical protein